MPERVTVSGPERRSAEVVVGRLAGPKDRRGGVFTGMTMRGAKRQMSASAERAGGGRGEALPDSGSDGPSRPRHEAGSTGPGLLMRRWQERTCNRLGNG